MRWGNPLRCAYAGQSVALVAQVGLISLFNDSTGRHNLAVLDYGCNVFGGDIHGFVVSQGQLGASPVQGIPVVANSAGLSGQVSAGVAGSVPPFGSYPTGATSSNGWPHDYPMVVLPPGWSLTAYSFTVNNGVFEASFFWETLYSEDLFTLSAGDSADDQ